MRCTHIECDIYDLKEDEFVLVEIFSRLYTNTLVDEKNPGGDISSLALARVTSTKYNLPHKPTLITAVSTNMNAIASEEGRDLPWWLYLLAILIGLAILILLILLLWRVSFKFNFQKYDLLHNNIDIGLQVKLKFFRQLSCLLVTQQKLYLNFQFCEAVSQSLIDLFGWASPREKFMVQTLPFSKGKK